MAYRSIDTRIWKDSWFLDLDSVGKLVFLYVCTNDRTNVIGLYELSPRIIAFETGLPLDQVQAQLDAFEQAGKIRRGDGWLWVVNLLRYNALNPTGAKLQAHILSVVQSVPPIPLRTAFIVYYKQQIPYLYGMDTLSTGQDICRTDAVADADAAAVADAEAALLAAAALADVGIAEPKRTELARLDWVTPDYIHDMHEAWKRRRKRDPATGLGLLVRMIESGDEPPNGCADDDWRRFT